MRSPFSRVVPLLFLFGALAACSDEGERPATGSSQEDELRALAPDPTGLGPNKTVTAEYKLPAAVDRDVLTDRKTEVWARVYRPETLSGDHPVLIFLHGNHGTCGTGTNPRVDSSVQYTSSGTCPAGYVVTPNHEGYAYLAERLASWGYVVVSVNANRGITAANGIQGDFGLNLARGRLVLRHLALLAAWNRGDAAPASLGTSLKGKLDLSNIGLLGHSRGGEGIRAAYNQYKDPGSPWPKKIGSPVTFRGLFEIGPVDGQTDRVLDANGTAWNVLLPMCDGDVSDLQGMHPFDRMLAGNGENVSTPKGMFAIWGTNHNFYNTEWQTSDSGGCSGTGHKALFQVSGESGSPEQREAGAFGALAFFRANVGKSLDRTLAQTLDPKYEMPAELTSITRVERAYVDTLDVDHTAKLEDFASLSAVGRSGLAHALSGVSVQYGGVDEHDEALTAARVKWQKAGANTFLQLNLGNTATKGLDATTFETLDFRTSLTPRSKKPVTPVSFGIRLEDSDAKTSNVVSLRDYVELAGFGGHTVLETARVPLSAFTGIDLAKLSAVRFVFDDTAADEVFLADVRLEKPTTTPLPPTPLVPITPSHVGNGYVAPPEMRVVSSGNRMLPLRRVPGGVELELESDASFPVSNELAVLRVGGAIASLDVRYTDELKLTRVVFTIKDEDFAPLVEGDEVKVEYGRRLPTTRWTFGQLVKSVR